MTVDLMADLPVLLPKATQWAEEQSLVIAKGGLALDKTLLDVGRRVGVQRPELIRVSLVQSIPLPDDPALQAACAAAGFLSECFNGLTLGHGIYIREERATVRLLSHEFRHVFQYEQAGSIAGFLSEYLRQIFTIGYDQAPLEIDARAHEIDNL